MSPYADKGVLCMYFFCKMYIINDLRCMALVMRYPLDRVFPTLPTDMKKTILLTATLAASSLVASAATLNDGENLGLGITTYTSDSSMWTDTNFSVSMMLDVDKLKTILTDCGVNHTNYNLVQFSLRSEASDHAHTMGTMAIYTSSSTTTSSIWTTANGTTGSQNMSGSSGVYLSNYVDDQWFNVDAASLTMAHDSNNGTYTLLTVHLSDGTFLEYEKTESGLRWSNTIGVSSITIGSDDAATNPVTQAWLFDTKLSVEEAKAINKQLIPEPTTATLSLLALAALAARRRRK